MLIFCGCFGLTLILKRSWTSRLAAGGGRVDLTKFGHPLQQLKQEVGGGDYSLNLSRHLWYHMVPSPGLPAGVGRAMLEKGLELMEMWGMSFFRAAM